MSRFAPHNQRIHLTASVHYPFGLISGFAGDPQRVVGENLNKKMYRYYYELTQFRRAVYTLATGEGDIRKRLLIIFQGDLSTISSDQLPEGVREDYKWVKNQITKFSEKYNGYNAHFETEDGSLDYLIPTKIEATFYRIRNKTGSKIARKIYEIWEKLDEDNRQ